MTKAFSPKRVSVRDFGCRDATTNCEVLLIRCIGLCVADRPHFEAVAIAVAIRLLGRKRVRRCFWSRARASFYLETPILLKGKRKRRMAREIGKAFRLVCKLKELKSSVPLEPQMPRQGEMTLPY